MRLLMWSGFCAFYFLAGWFLPWWAPCFAGFTIGFLKIGRNSHQGWKQGLCAATAAFIPAFLSDLESNGRISLAISGLMGLQFHPLGYFVSLCVAGFLGGLSASCGANLREVLVQNRQIRNALERAEDTPMDSQDDAGDESQSAGARPSRDRFGP